MEIKIKVIDQNKAIVKLFGLANDLKNPRALYARWGIQGLKWVDENFVKQGALLQEGKWKDIADSTKAARRKGKKKSKYGPQILIDTGELRKSFNTRFSDKGVYVGTEKTYAIYHESDAPRKKLPQRRMLPRQKDESILKRLVKTTNNYIKEKGKNIFK